MKIRRKVSILLIVLTFIMSINITAFASLPKKTESQQEEQYSSGELNKIEAERQFLYDNIKTQLEAQNALDQFELFKPIADEEINQKYFASSPEAKVSYYAPGGGNITSQDGNLITVAEFMTAANAAALYQKSHSGGVNDLIIGLTTIGIGLKWTGPGAIISTVLVFNAFRNESLWGLVTVGTDNVVMYTVQDTDDLRTTTVISKWSDYAFMSDSFSTGKNIAHQVY